MATVPDTETHVTSAADIAAMSRRTRLADAAACVILPGYCVARAVAATGENVAAAAAEAETRAIAGARETGTGLIGALTASAAPIGETASAVRYASVAFTTGVVALVLLAIIAFVWWEFK